MKKKTRKKAAIILGTLALVAGAAIPTTIETKCPHVYEEDPTYVPIGTFEETIQEKRQNSIVYKEAKFGTNKYLECQDESGGVYLFELPEIDYERLSTEIHAAELPRKDVKRSLIEKII